MKVNGSKSRLVLTHVQQYPARPRAHSLGRWKSPRSWGGEYTTANAGVIYNQGQQRVEGYADDYVPFCCKVQVTDVNRPLIAVYDIRENDNTNIYSKKYGDWIINDNSCTATNMYSDQGTSNTNAWVFTRQP